MTFLLVTVAGFLLDLAVGDPQGWWHPVRSIGWLVTALEGKLRRCFPGHRCGELAAGAARLRERFPNLRLLLVTRGRAGSVAYWGDQEVSCPGYPVEAIDTTGAGDTFCGCCLHHVLTWGLEGFDRQRLREMLSFANAAAGLVTTKKGALRSMPEPEAVRRLLAEGGVEG